MLFSAYRREDFADPEGFLAQLGIVLTDFSDEVVAYVTGPRTGLQRRSKWPPSISEVVDACEQHADFLKRTRASQPVSPVHLLAAPPLRPGSLANVFVAGNHARYPSLVEWSGHAADYLWRFGKNDAGALGIWVNQDVITDQAVTHFKRLGGGS